MALKGNEILQVLGLDAAGRPAAITQQTTTQAIADLASPSGKDIAITNLNTVGAATLTAAAITGLLIVRGGAQAGTAFTDTTDTAANLIAALPVGAEIGDSFYFKVVNTTNAQETIAAGVGVTLSGVQQIAQNTVGTFLLTWSGANAVTIFGESIVDRGIDNFNLTADPGVNQDSTQGYGVGSIVFNTTAGALRWWDCRSAAVGAAAWVFSGADYANGGTNPPNDSTQAGSSTAIMLAEGNINRQVPGVAAQVTPAATGGDYVVAVYSLPASFFDGLAGTNRGITINANGNFAANGNNKRIKLFFNATTAVVGALITGGTLMADTGVVATNAGAWQLSGNAFKRGAAGSNTQTVTSNGAIAGGSHLGLSPSVDTVAVENAPILIAVTINNTTTATDAGIAFFDVNAMN